MKTRGKIEKLRASGDILEGEKGLRFYHRAKSPQAVARKKKARKAARKSRKGKG